MSMVASKMDPVSQNSVWEEHVKKENRVLTLGTNFQIANPNKLEVVTEKINHTVPTSKPTPDSVMAATQKLHMMSALKETHKTPTDRYALPVTGNMEYGFFSTAPMVPGNPMFSHGIKQVDETRYGDHYKRMAGTGPFNAPKQGV